MLERNKLRRRSTDKLAPYMHIARGDTRCLILTKSSAVPGTAPVTIRSEIAVDRLTITNCNSKYDLCIFISQIDLSVRGILHPSCQLARKLLQKLT